MIRVFAFQMLRGKPLTVFGDRAQIRDFVNVADVVQANLKAARTNNVSGAFNIGSGSSISINHLIALLHTASGMRDSLRDISAAATALGFAPAVRIENDLAEYTRWAKEETQRVYIRTSAHHRNQPTRQ